MKTLIRKDDVVVVNSGKSKGSRGRVLKVFRESDRVLVEGVNLVTKATKPDARNNQPGGFVRKESSVHLSNVQLYCGSCEKGVRVKHERGNAGKLKRLCGKCGTSLDKGK